MQQLACLRIALASALVLAALGCGSSGKKAATEKESVAEALTKHVHFAHGLSKPGEIGKADAAARKVKLTGAAGLHIAPDADSLMSLDADNPDQDKNAAKNVLCQFAGSKSHAEVPVKEVLADQSGGAGDDGGTSGDSDAGSGGSSGGNDTDQLHLELTFDVDADICESLCNKRFSAQLVVAIALADGAISAHQLRSVTLDCTHDGDPKQCSDDDKQDGGGGDDAGTNAADGGGASGSRRRRQRFDRQPRPTAAAAAVSMPEAPAATAVRAWAPATRRRSVRSRRLRPRPALRSRC